MQNLHIPTQRVDPLKGYDVEISLTNEQFSTIIVDCKGFIAVGTPEVKIHLHQRHDNSIKLHGSFTGKVDCDCGRCLKSITLPLEFKLSAIFFPEKKKRKGAVIKSDDEEIELEEEDLDSIFYRDDTLLLDEFLSESILLELPGFALCSESCAGLCSACGNNLNDKDCGCDTFQPDPRLAVLAEIKARMEKKQRS